MKKLGTVLAAGVLLCLLVAGNLHAATINVPGDYATIQAAITAAAPDDVIMVAAGTYYESTLTINKALTIQGAGIGSSIIDASASVVTGTMVTIDITSGNVLFDGFTLKMGASLRGVTAKSTSSASTITISHNRIEGYGPTSTEEWNYGLIAGYGSVASLVFTYNEITNCGDNTILLERHVGPTDVSYNTFDRTAGDWSSDAYFCMNYGAPDITTLQRVSHNTIDMGAGTEFTNDTRGTAITFCSSFTGVAGGFTNIEITDNVIVNLKSYRRGIGTWNNAPSGTSSGAVGDIQGLVIERNTVTNAPGYLGQRGIDLLGLATGSVVQNNTVEGVEYGFRGVAWNGNLPVGALVNENSFAGCTTNAVWQGVGTLDAENNWWGTAVGSEILAKLSGSIDYDPWLASAFEVSVEPPSTLTNCAGSRTVTFDIDQLAGAPEKVRGYEVKFTVNTAVVSVAGITEGTYLSSAGETQFYPTGSGASWTVTCAILGGDAGGAGAGTLFSVELASVAEGTSAIDITSVKVRDLDNAPLASGSVDGSITLECVAPTIDPITPAEGGWYNAAPVIALGFHDNTNLDYAQYNYNGGSWVDIFTGLDGADWTNAAWTLPGFAGLPQGTNTIYFRVYDDAGNMGTASWQFYKDTIAPQPPTNFVALPGHDKTHLSWTNPTGDDTFAGVEIRFNAWLDYPEYEATTPVYPPNAGAGTYVALVAGTTYDDNPRTPRDIYYYAAFSKDLAGNYSALGTTAYDRCTSYWLGDAVVSGAPPLGDGYVNLSDLSAFSQTFGVSEGGLYWDNNCDFGPTDDNRRFGIPLPDDIVDFEDLMILAMNYNKVLPSGLDQLAAAARGIEDLDRLVGLEIVANDDGTFSVVLANRARTLKGMRLVVEVTGGVIEGVVRGSVLGGSGDCFFGLAPAAANRADISVAALGVETPLAISGEAARLAVRPDGAGAARVRIVSVDLRDLDNTRTEIAANGEGEAPFVPKATALLQNFPNPFNPTTTMTFDLVAPGHVRIDVYDVSGRLVATPVNAEAAAGRHTVEWNGRDASGSLAPSGMYFYRMKTAGYEATRKMILLR